MDIEALKAKVAAARAAYDEARSHPATSEQHLRELIETWGDALRELDEAQYGPSPTFLHTFRDGWSK